MNWWGSELGGGCGVSLCAYWREIEGMQRLNGRKKETNLERTVELSILQSMALRN